MTGQKADLVLRQHPEILHDFRSASYTKTAADIVFEALADSGRRRTLDRLRVRGGLTLFRPDTRLDELMPWAWTVAGPP